MLGTTMRMRRAGFAGLSTVAMVAALMVTGPGAGASATTTDVTADGTLTVTTASPTIGSDLTLHFATDAGQVTALNWVAIYDNPADGPINQVYSGHPSTDYQYVTTASGDVTFDTSALTAGTKIAYFLYDDGYQWLARPVAFTLLAPVLRRPDGTLALSTSAPTVGDQLTFAYSTSAGRGRSAELGWCL